MEVFCKSDIGKLRNENQDNFGFGTISPVSCWAVVCDGMGGANGGSTASRMAVEIIQKRITDNYGSNLSKEELCDYLVESVAQANIQIFEKACEETTLTGMGTTCDLAFVENGVLHIVHVGDSRVYIIRNNIIKQLTEDHSVVQEMVRRGELTPEQAENHPNKNFITRALGIKPHVHIDYIESNFEPGDFVIICSDGLSNEISNDDIVEIIQQTPNTNIANSLVQKALESGGHDNITVAVIF